MKRMITYGSINQFRHVVTSITHQTRYQGVDAVGKQKYDHTIALPKLQVVASEKIHGTNGAVCYSNPDGFWVQSRKNIITVEKDNAGCAFMAYQNETEWMNIIHSLAEAHSINLDTHVISLYFEWCGGSIQKNSAMTGVDKSAILFQHFKVSPLVNDLDDPNQENAEWYPTNVGDSLWEGNTHARIYNIMNFDTWVFEIDFNNPKLSLNQFAEHVDKVVEPKSPVGVYFGENENIGEGIVCTIDYLGSVHKFKVKGDKHSNSKVKKLTPVDEEKEQAKINFANDATPAWRLEQMFKEIFPNYEDADIKFTGDFLRAVVNDVMKEEGDLLAGLNLEPRDVNGKISAIARQWFIGELDKIAGIG